VTLASWMWLSVGMAFLGALLGARLFFFSGAESSPARKA
jgi:hypothetical protein